MPHLTSHVVPSAPRDEVVGQVILPADQFLFASGFQPPGSTHSPHRPSFLPLLLPLEASPPAERAPFAIGTPP